MYCTKCGRELSPEASFCGACGTPVRTAAKNPTPAVTMPVESMTAAPVSRNCEAVPGSTWKRGKIKAPILVLVLLVAAAGIWFGWTKVSGGLSYYTNGFDTPQEALDYFVDAVADMDYEKALTAFPIGRAADNYNLYATADRLGGWQPYYLMIVPSSSEGNKQLNQHFFAVSVERQINNFIFSFFAGPELREGMPVQGEDVIRELFKNYNAEDIKNLKAVQMTFATEELQKRDVHQENAKKLAGVYGGDTLEDYIVTYQIGGNAYVGGVEFIKYGEKYYIWNLNSSIGGTSALCYVMPAEEWERETSEELPEEEPAAAEAPAYEEEPAETEAPAAAEWRFRVGLIVQDMTDMSQSYFCSAAEEKAEEMGLELICYDQGEDVKSGISVVNALIDDGIDAILIDSLEASEIVPFLQDAWDAGVVVGFFSFELAKESQAPESIADEILENTIDILWGEKAENLNWLFFDKVTAEEIDDLFYSRE